MPARTALLALALLGASCSSEMLPVLDPLSGSVGFVFVGDRDDLGYNQAAWEGADAVAKTFPDLEVDRVENVPEDGNAGRVMQAMIDDGATLIFATSFGYLDQAYAVAKANPHVVVVHQGGVEPQPALPNFGTYWGAVYERVYQAGIVAGSASRSDRLGFIAAFPIPATFNNVNAFTLGARSVNPKARTYLRFTSAWCDPRAQRDAMAGLVADRVDVVTHHQDCPRAVLARAEAAGVGSVGYHYDGSEAAPRGWLIGSVWTWRSTFVDIVRAVLDDRFAGSPYDGDHRGAVRTDDNPFVLTEPSSRVPAAAITAVARAERRFRAGRSPFEGPLRDRDGKLRVRAGARPSPDEIDRMDYLVEGVVGALPG